MNDCHFEWDVEEVTNVSTPEHEENEVLEHHHFNSFVEACRFASKGTGDATTRYDIALVCDGPQGRSWAYIQDYGNNVLMLPKYTADAMDHRDVRVPVSYQKEVWEYNRNPT